MHLTLGILRKSQAVFYALSFFWLDGFAVPHPSAGNANRWALKHDGINHMTKEKSKKAKPFQVLVVIYLAFACMVFLNELLAKNIENRFPGGNYPIEHEYSWERVQIFCAGAIVSVLVYLFFTFKKKMQALLPDFKLVIALSFLPISLSLLLNYPSISGWCCEIYNTRFFGYPFSYMMGSDLFQRLLNFELLKIIKYYLRPYKFFLDLLFWSNIFFVLLSMFNMVWRKSKLLEQTQENLYSENR